MNHYWTDDITFCSHRECHRKSCYRHPDNRINKAIPFSVADFENTKYCAKVHQTLESEGEI